MTMGFPAHFAPSGAAGMDAKDLPSPGTNIAKASCLPSGDQLRPPGPSLTLVTRAVAPVSIQRI